MKPEISIVTGHVERRFGVQRAAELLAAAGFTCVDYGAPNSLYCHSGGLFAQSDKDFFGYFEAQRKIYEDRGLHIRQIHCPFNCPPDNITQQEMVAFVAGVKRSIRAAAVLGAQYAVVHPFIPVTWQQDADISYTITDRLCAEYAELGEKVGVKVALENMPGSDTTVPYSCAEQFLQLFEKLDSEYLVVCLDSGHANWALPTGTLPDMARALGKKLQVLHLHDNGGNWDNHAMPFQGTVGWNALCRALGESGYAGTVNLETCGMTEMSDELFIKALEFQSAIAAELAQKIADAYPVQPKH